MRTNVYVDGYNLSSAPRNGTDIYLSEYWRLTAYSIDVSVARQKRRPKSGY